MQISQLPLPFPSQTPWGAARNPRCSPLPGAPVLRPCTLAGVGEPRALPRSLSLERERRPTGTRKVSWARPRSRGAGTRLPRSCARRGPGTAPRAPPGISMRARPRGRPALAPRSPRTHPLVHVFAAGLAFLLHALLQEIDAQLEAEVLLLQVIEVLGQSAIPIRHGGRPMGRSMPRHPFTPGTRCGGPAA